MTEQHDYRDALEWLSEKQRRGLHFDVPPDYPMANAILAALRHMAVRQEREEDPRCVDVVVAVAVTEERTYGVAGEDDFSFAEEVAFGELDESLYGAAVQRYTLRARLPIPRPQEVEADVE